MARPLTRRQARALVNARLAALGHGGDFVSPAALEELRARAGHAAEAFGAALGAVLFLAATEEVPRIEPGLVMQAVPAGETSSPPTAPHRLWMVFAVAFCLACAGAGLVWVMHRPAPRPSVAGPKPPPVAVTSAPPTVTTALPAIYVSPPIPLPPPFDLPTTPPARISLDVPAGDRATLASFTVIAEKLRQAGFSDVTVEKFNSAKIQTGALRNHVVYYFKEDAKLAENVAAALEIADSADHIRNHWSPVLVVGRAGIAAHPPGSIDVFAP
jgi:hypothetical protein